MDKFRRPRDPEPSKPIAYSRDFPQYASTAQHLNPSTPPYNLREPANRFSASPPLPTPQHLNPSPFDLREASNRFSVSPTLDASVLRRRRNFENVKFREYRPRSQNWCLPLAFLSLLCLILYFATLKQPKLPFCAIEDPVSDKCRPCPPHAYCVAGRIAACEPGYVATANGCSFNSNIGKLAEELASATDKRLSLENGILSCNQGLNTSTAQQLNTSTRARLPLSELRSWLSESFSQRELFTEAADFFQQSLYSQEHQSLYIDFTASGTFVSSKGETRPLGCEVSRFIRRNLLVVVVTGFTFVALVLHLVKAAVERPYLSLAEQIYSQTLEQIMKGETIAVNRKFLLGGKVSQFDTSQREKVLRHLEAIRRADEQLGLYSEGNETFWVRL